MITGDNVMTAISIGMQLKLGAHSDSAWTLEYCEKRGKYYWLDFD
jgi:magnesium-transporting ATPase (P-type)